MLGISRPPASDDDPIVEPVVVGKWGWWADDDVDRISGPDDIDVSNAKPGYEDFYKSDRVFLTGGYKFEVPNGTYKVEMLFAETYVGITQEGGRYFDIAIQDEVVATSYDPFKEGGGVYAASQLIVDEIMVVDELIEIEFRYKADGAKVNGILLYDENGNEILAINCGVSDIDQEWID
jgi:hypothetical protein